MDQRVANDLGRCIMCGAEPDDPCTVISGSEDESPGDRRAVPHFYRSNKGINEPPRGSTPVKNEPAYWG